ncbi:C-type mannose receptor 2-like [Dicentrarchus labrax]|uniref:C-type mannose receptor 2-like n=1 Tax=Dicentrarchus labrax TaxID=13489 RepID=UPI0021F67123|nr:C-type mannose receptor 2-like [Dicentrarchus labrax]
MERKTVFFTDIFLMLLMAVTGTESNTRVGRPYHFLNIPMTRSEAQSFCRVNYADLATVDNMKEYVQLLESIGSADVSGIWIGLERSASYRWVWSDGIGEQDVYPFSEDKQDGDCVMMKTSGYWEKSRCTDLKASLCFEYDSQGTESYFLNTTLLSWRDAQSSCRQHHTDLVSVKTKEQNTDIYGHTSGYQIWLGMIADNWMWSDGSPTSFRNWENTNPDNNGGAENCVVIRKSFQNQWDDTACDRSYPFVCYGEQKIRRTTVKVRISSEGNLNLATLSDSLLKQIQAQLEEQSGTEVKLRWQAAKNGQIFQHNDNGSKETGC